MPFQDIESTRDATLRENLERVVKELHGDTASIACIERNRSVHSSSYEADIIEVSLVSGASTRVFLKDFGNFRLAKDEMQLRREREMRVYRDVLRGSCLGPPEYYGSVWDADEGRFWLMLEFVEGVELRWCGVERYPLAAAWLGRMQGHFRTQLSRLESFDFLERHDTAYFYAKADRAHRDATQVVPALRPRIEGLLDHFDRIVGMLANQPRSLIHGTYRPRSILLSLDREPERVSPYDWENAGIGATLFDLAALTDGFEPPELDRILEAYRREASANGVNVPPMDQMKYVINCFRFFRVIRWLGMSIERGYSPDAVYGLVEYGETLGQVIS